ncbi:MAG: serine hydrolase domain-containing protein [Pseudomonadota bacterium]
MPNSLNFPAASQKVSPWAAAGFERVQEEFQKLHETGEELGSALCVYLHGKPVVNLWGGFATPEQKSPWQKDTMVSTFSACKAMTALCLLQLIDRGEATLDDPVVAHWPEFASVDSDAKSQVTLRHLLNHSAGLPVARTNRAGDVYNWHRMIRALEQAPLLWPAGSRTAYHAVTFGHLVGEVVRRISGQMPSEYFERNIAGPLNLDYTLRMIEVNAGRTAVCDGYDWKVRLRCGLFTHVLPRFGDWRTKYFKPCGSDYHPSSLRWQSAEAPAISGFGTAEALARVYSCLAADGALNGNRILSEQMVRQIAGVRPEQVEEHGTGNRARIGLGMFFNLAPIADLGPNPNSFGHCGMGGTTSFADPDHGIGFGYVCNHLYQPSKNSGSIIGDRAARLARTLYECLAES